MDTCGSETSCKNAPYGCTFASSSEVDIVKHFQWDCTFHPVRCFKCNRTVRKVNFEKHYIGYCRHNSAPPCPAPEEVPDVGVAEAIRIMSEEQHFLRECVTECRLGVESLSHAVKDVAADVAEVKVIKTNQEELQAIVKGQADVIQEHGKSITVVLEKVDKMQEDMGALVKECVEKSRLGVEMLSHVTDNVAAGAADVKLMKTKQEDLEAIVKGQGDVIQEHGKSITLVLEKVDKMQEDISALVKECITELKLRTGREKDLESSVRHQEELIKGFEKAVLTNAEKINRMQKDVGTIVERFEKVDGLVKEVRVLTHPLADQSRIHWYVENVSRYIEESETRRSIVKSDVFVVRGYSARLISAVEKHGTGIRVGIFLHLCRGPNDSLLRWPFRIPYTLSLIHPNDASKTKDRKVTLPGRYPECFEKPKEEENEGLGTPSLCTVDELQKEDFIKNDAICFSLTLNE